MARLKIGIIGCGAIAQIQHLPHLRELNDQFAIGGLADLSPKLLAVVGEEYGVPPERRFLDYHELVRSDIDGVIVCPSGSHAAPSIAASEAGKHVLVEKPMCTTAEEAEAMVVAAAKAGTILMVAYMKRHEPAYQFAQARVAEMSEVRFIQVNHLHPHNDLHTAEPFRYGASTRPERLAHTEPPEPTETLLARHLAASHALADAATANIAAQEAATTALRTATETNDKPAAKAAIDAMWASIYTMYKQLQEMELAWNALSPAVAGEE